MDKATKAIKPRRCKHCRTKFTPVRIFEVWCSPECGAEIAKAKITKKQAQEATKQRQERRKAKEKLKTRAEWKSEAQREFNKFIRCRDADLPCVSCGRYDHEIENTYGGKWDCGHYLSRGSHPELAFEELNAAKQCKSCNGGAGNYARKNYTVTASYREELIRRIGIENVEFLEGPHEPQKFTIEILKEIKAKYSKLARELEKQ